MKKFLIVVDMQKDFVDGALGTKEAQAIVQNVARKIEAFDGEIIVTYDTHGENYMQTAEGRKLPVPHCIKGTPGWQGGKEMHPHRKAHLRRGGASAGGGKAGRRRGLHGGVRRPVHRHLRGQQRAAGEGRLSGDGADPGRELLRRRDPRDP